MSHVIQVRDVPDDLHRALTDAARAEGLSLNKFVARELSRAIVRREAVATNRDVARRAHRRMRGTASISLEEIATSVHAGRRPRR